MSASLMTERDDIVVTMNSSDPSASTTVTASISEEDDSRAGDQSYDQWHEWRIARVPTRDSILLQQVLRLSVPEPQDVLVWYQDALAQEKCLPGFGLKGTFPVAFPVVDVTALAGTTYYLLDPSPERFEPCAQLHKVIGAHIRKIVFRQTTPDEIVAFADDFGGAQVSVSARGDDVTDAQSRVESTSGDSDCFEKVQGSLKELASLPQNWNSYGAPRIDPKVIEFVKDFLREHLEADTLPPYVVPTSGGGVQLEWHTERTDLEVRFDTPGFGVFFYEDSEREIEGEIPDGLVQLIDILREFKK